MGDLWWNVMKCEKWIDQHNTSVGQRKIWSPTGIDAMTSQTPGGHSGVIWNFIFTHLSHSWWYSGRLSRMNSVKWPCCPWVLVAQWIECPPGVRKVMGSIFSLSEAHVLLISSLSQLIYTLLAKFAIVSHRQWPYKNGLRVNMEWHRSIPNVACFRLSVVGDVLDYREPGTGYAKW